MAIDANIPMKAQGIDVSQIYNNALTNLTKKFNLEQAQQNAPLQNQLLQQKVQTGQQAVDTGAETATNEQQKLLINTLGNVGRELQPILSAGISSGNMQQTVSSLIAMKNRYGNNPEVAQRINKAIQMAQTDPQGLLNVTNQAIATDLQVNPRKTPTEGMFSAKTEFFPGGSIQGAPNGETIVRNDRGQVVQGDERVKILKGARQYKIDEDNRQAQLRVDTEIKIQEAKNSSETSKNAFEAIDGLRTSIQNLSDVIPLVKDGANTGPIERYFLSLKPATIKLERLQKQLGLDVVQATTFGALSKGELDTAMTTALPVGLEGKELVNWVVDAVKKKENVMRYLEDQVLFLSGKNEQGQKNTQADWIRKQRTDYKDLLEANNATEADIQATMKQMNMSKSEVVKEMKRRTYGR